MLYRFAVQQKTTYVKSQRYILIDEVKNKAFYGISYNKTQAPNIRPFVMPDTVLPFANPILCQVLCREYRTTAEMMMPKTLCIKFSERIVSSVLMQKYSINLAAPPIIKMIAQLNTGRFFIFSSISSSFNKSSVLSYSFYSF